MRRPGKIITLRLNSGVEKPLNAVRPLRASLIEIDHYGERLNGCIECNCWRGDKSAFIVELSVEDFQALRGLIAPSTRRACQSGYSSRTRCRCC